MSRQYFDLFDSVPYSEKLMGGPTTTILLCLLAETFELFYGENRQAGQAMVNSYCKARHHLQVPKPEQFLLPKPDLGLNLPPLKELPQLNSSVPVSRQNIYSIIFIFAEYLFNYIHIFNSRRRNWIGNFDTAQLTSLFKVAGSLHCISTKWSTRFCSSE